MQFNHDNQRAARRASWRLRRTLCVSAWLRLVVLSLVAPVAAGCSVGLALHGEEQPDLSVLKVGADRSQIEAKLGPPETEASLSDGRTRSTYLYEVGNESSAGRAAVHAGMDILTFGIWELVGTPLEAMQGEEMELVVTYDASGKAEAFDLAEADGAHVSSTIPAAGPSQ